MKYDSIIMSIAIDMGADCLYTHDEDFKKYPKSFIDVVGLDESPPSYSEVGIFLQSEEE